MYLGLKEFTGAVNKITDMVSGDKQVPGILLRLAKDETDPTTGLLQVCYTDGHKATVEELKVQLEETDFIGDVATIYEQLSQTIASCQPYGKVEVDTLRIEYFPETLKLSVEQWVSHPDATGEGTTRSKMGIRYNDISRLEPSDSVKTKLLLRQKYDDIFTGEQLDEYNKAEFISLLGKTATEKGKLIYIASTRQGILVANQAHAVDCPISGYELSEDEKQFIKQELEANGITSDEDFQKVCKEKTDRVHHSFVLTQQMAKSISSMLSRLVSDDIYIWRVDKFCNIFVDNDDEKFGIWFEVPQGSRIHLNYVESFSSLKYRTYQLTFLKDLLEVTVKQALATTKSETVALKFEKELDEETGREAYYMSLEGGSASKSTSNMSRLRADGVVDAVGNLVDKTLNVSLKVLADMLAQVKTESVAFDIDVSENDSVKIRVAEINRQKQATEYAKVREGLDANTPTPIELKLEMRDKILETRQFTMLSK